MTEYIALNKIRIDGGTQARAGLNDDVIADYAAAMRAGAAFAPIIVFHDGTDYWLADGFHRVRAAQSINVDTIAVDIRQGDRRESILHSVGANAQHGLRRTNADKRRAVETLLRDEEWSRWSDREIARQCAVHHQMVGKLRDELSLDDSSSERTYTTKHGTTTTMHVNGMGRNSDAASILVEDDESDWLDEERDTPEPVISAPPPAQRFEHARTVMTSSGSNEWYTPAHLIERARTFLGAIDLDPASSERANETVQAQRFYDARTDGLAQHWTGRIWLNPPYGDEASKFVAKAIREYQAGNATDVLLLLKAATDTGWFRPLFDYSMCFIYGRVSFATGDGSESATATFPSVVVYLGQRHDEFRACFSEIGAVMRRIDGLHV